MSDEIDRLTPTRRPPGRALMRQRWAELGFLHWPVPVAQLRPLVPAALELDTFDGQAWVGLVPFTMTGVRPAFLPPFPPVSNFHEINVRTYVHHRGREPGVWFFSLDAASSLAVRVARATFHLPYHRATMSLTREAADSPVVTYRSERRWPGPLPAGCRLRYGPTGAVAPARPGTLLRGRVHHDAYPLRPGAAPLVEETLVAAAGITRPAGAPLVHYASEVRVEVFATELVG
jgi:uncharacterized protein YqjF (DUF2071 family)